MRIIAGTCRGRRLKTPTWSGLRPTSDKLRETLFNIVAPRVPGARLLDVFAGTGAMGLESLSRGAAHALFVESDRRAADLIQTNATLCGVQDRCAIIRATAQDALSQTLSGTPFDLVLLDPPYGFEGLEAVLESAMRHLSPVGRLVLEHAWRHPAPMVKDVDLLRTVRSGDSALSIFQRSGSPDLQIAGSPDR